MTPVNPTWVEGTITFNGETWTHVGVRYKGNSSLTRAWQSGSAKLPLKLDFDEFEEISGRSITSGSMASSSCPLATASMMRTYLQEALSYSFLEAAGLAAPETAFYEVILDHGEGPVSLGLYTAVEVVDDTVIERCFGDAKGNIYEADGTAASLAAGTRADQGQLPEGEQRGSRRLDRHRGALRRAARTQRTRPRRVAREARSCLRRRRSWSGWLNAVLQHWDSYGAMTHNYYLYHDPATDRLVWISWDHNEAMPSCGRETRHWTKRASATNWPLIRFLLDDATYYAEDVAYRTACALAHLCPTRW